MELQIATPNPLLTIWTQPRATIRRIVDVDPHYHVLLLACLAGFVEALDTSAEQSAGDSLPILAIIAICAVVGPLLGVLGLMVSGWILRWAGGVLGGRATVEETRAALAWSRVPTLWAALVWLVYIALAGSKMFTSATPYVDAHPALGAVIPALEAIRVIATVWAFIVMLKCLGEVHDFSAWRALGATLLAGLVTAAVILIPALCIGIALLV